MSPPVKYRFAGEEIVLALPTHQPSFTNCSIFNFAQLYANALECDDHGFLVLEIIVIHCSVLLAGDSCTEVNICIFIILLQLNLCSEVTTIVVSTLSLFLPTFFIFTASKSSFRSEQACSLGQRLKPVL